VIWLAIPAVAAAAYYLLAVVAALWWGRSAACPVSAGPPAPLSILKPVHGRDPRFYEAIVSHATQDYPEFEILFGVSDPRDPALQDIARLKREFPGRRIEVLVVETNAPNAKAGVLAELAKRARYPLLLVNDSDIVAPPEYLRAVTAPLADPKVGLDVPLSRRRGFVGGAMRSTGNFDRVRAQRAGGAPPGPGGVRAWIHHGISRRDLVPGRRL
jgi:ceramide glucosyltransferase